VQFVSLLTDIYFQINQRTTHKTFDVAKLNDLPQRFPQLSQNVFLEFKVFVVIIFVAHIIEVFFDFFTLIKVFFIKFFTLQQFQVIFAQQIKIIVHDLVYAVFYKFFFFCLLNY
jgi:hypothetical protein